MNESRKEAIRKYKEQVTPQGIYAVRCVASGKVWVGASRNLEATKNGCWFSLRTGAHIENSLQTEWNTHGEPAFRYEILETLDPELAPLAVPDLLKEKRQHWIERLSAIGLL